MRPRSSPHGRYAERASSRRAPRGRYPGIVEWRHYVRRRRVGPPETDLLG